MNDSLPRIREPLRFALAGLHGSGKTTLCHEIVADLRKTGINATVAAETARESLFLMARDIKPEMEIEILGLQLVEEMRSARHGDVVLCDRCALDTVAYTVARFQRDRLSVNELAMVDAIDAFGRAYMKTYTAIFFLPDQLNHGATGDAFRDNDTVSADLVRAAFESLFRTWALAPVVLQSNTAKPTILSTIRTAIHRSAIAAS